VEDKLHKQHCLEALAKLQLILISELRFKVEIHLKTALSTHRMTYSNLSCVGNADLIWLKCTEMQMNVGWLILLTQPSTNYIYVESWEWMPCKVYSVQNSIILFLVGNVAGQLTTPPPTCPGNTFTLRCTVTGDVNGITIWRVGGSSNLCVLLHMSTSTVICLLSGTGE